MAFEATTQLYQREANLLNARAQQQYDTYLSDLARSFGIAEGGLNANLEGRGILRSGEASTARTRLAAENQALKSKAMQDLEYQKNMNQINLLKQLASLQANANQQATTKSPRFNPPPAPKAPPKSPYIVDPKTSTLSDLNRARTAVTSSGMGSGRPRPIGTEERRVSYAGR